MTPTVYHPRWADRKSPDMLHGGPAPSPIRGTNYTAASSVEKHPGKQYRRRARFKSGAASIYYLKGEDKY